MAVSIAANKQKLTDLFAGPFPGHAITINYPMAERPDVSDVAVSALPVRDWLPWAEENYARMTAQQALLGDDAVPTGTVWTGTEIFAAAFGCPVHLYDDAMPPSALPLVTTAAEADALPEPTLDARPIARIFEFADLLRARLGPDVPIGVPDIQSPFDIAALIWRKEDLFVAMLEEPEAVHRLVEKCHRLLKAFFTAYLHAFPNVNLCHCPYAWAPPAQGVWLSEDEAGSLNTAMFEEFCLPSLVDLSDTFGGLFMHCCATADHQYGNFRRIPRLRGLNRVFQTPGPRPAIDTFSGHTVLIMAWMPEEEIYQHLRWAHPDTRFLFNPGPLATTDETRAMLDRLRAACEARVGTR
jgi:hypothetical protein